MALRKAQVKNAAQLGCLLTLSDAMTAHELAHAFGDSERFR
jgi:hypothetical protein